MSLPNPISIVICTYNRAEELALTLASMRNLEDEFIQGDELIIVDNNSSDGTAAVAQGFSCRLLDTRYVFEAKQGLCSARNRGLAEAVNQHILYFDDDVSIHSGCLAGYREAVESPDYANVSFFGGKIDIDWRGNKPRWWKSEDLPLLNGLMVRHDYGESDCHYPNRSHTPFGASFLIRRSLVDEIGNFDEALGPIGGSVARGDEVEFFIRAKDAGHIGLYVAGAVVGHRVHDSRFGLLALYRYGKEKGAAAVRLDGLSSARPLWQSVSFAIRGLYQLLKLRRDRFYQCVINIGIQRGVYLASVRRSSGS